MSQIQEMNAAVGALPPLLFEPTTRRIPPGLEGMEINEMRQKARAWVGPDLSRLPRHSLVMTLRQALEDDKVADRILRALPPQELAVAAVYRRYGGSVDGQVIRLELMARGLLEIIEDRTPYHTARKWKSNPIRALTESWVLISEQPDMGYYFSPHYSHGPEHSFERVQPARRHGSLDQTRRAAPVVDRTGRGSPAGRYHYRTLGGRGGARPVASLRLRIGPRIGEGPQERAPLDAGPPGHGEGRPPGQGPRFPAPRPARLLLRTPAAGGCGPDPSGTRHRPIPPR